MPRKTPAIKPYSTSILDYPESMSLYERESCVAEAKLAAERKINKEKNKEKAPKRGANSK
jgi:hypothetical protein